MSRAVTALALLAAAALAGCRGPSVSDTGYTGTWQRGNPRVTSTLWIADVGGRTQVRIGVDYQNLPDLVCDWEGSCEQRLEDGAVRRFRFETRTDPKTGRLVSSYEVWKEPGDGTRSTYVDELVLEPGGLVLQVQTVERDGVALEPGQRPTRVFHKVADGVAPPPRESS